MNKENIIDYVLQTPHNPNKKVLDDMLETLIEENGGTDNLTYSWNDLTDKPFEETERKTIICESYGKINPGPFLIDKWSVADLSLIEEGESYIVEIDGVEYGPSVARFVEEMQAGNMVLALQLFNPDSDSFEEFPVSIGDYAGDLYIYFEDGGTHNVTLKHLEKTLKQLDEKFIPETIARVEDIPEGLSGSWNDLTDKPFGENVEQGVLCEDMSWNGIVKYNISVGKWKKCDELIPDIVNVVNKLNGIENTIVGYENRPGHLVISEDSRVVYGYEENTLRYLIILEDNVTTTVDSVELTFTQSGFYVNTGVEGTYPVTYNYTQLKTLDEKFIPDTIVRQSALEAYETEIVDRVLSALPTWTGGTY